MAAAGLLGSRARAACILVVGQEGGGGDRRGDAAIDGSLATARATAGAICGGAQPAGLAFFVIFLFSRRSSGAGGAAGPGAGRRGAEPGPSVGPPR